MSNFETWWEREGQEFLYALNTTTDDDIKLVAEFAWKNGAYCAEQAEQEPVSMFEWQNGNPVGLRKADPVRTKDLTDDEIAEIVTELDSKLIMRDATELEIARAVIAAYKEKNK